MDTIAIRSERHADVAAREALLDAAYGSVRFTKTSERLRESRVPAKGLSFVASEGGRIVGTVRFWHVSAGKARPALLLGPLAVACEYRNRGIGSALVNCALAEAKRQRQRAVLLVGDREFYGRFGFSAEKTAPLWLPGPCEPHRLLALELVPGALDGASGLVVPSDPKRVRGRPARLAPRVGIKPAAIFAA